MKQIKAAVESVKHIHGPNIYDPNCAACRNGDSYRSTVINRHLLDEDDPYYKPEETLKPKYGYHNVKIEKGVFGQISKIREELEELEDAHNQGVRIMVMCELADLYGAIQAYAAKHNVTMDDLRRMAEVTANAFAQGHRK